MTTTMPLDATLTQGSVTILNEDGKTLETIAIAPLTGGAQPTEVDLMGDTLIVTLDSGKRALFLVKAGKPAKLVKVY